MCCPSVSSPRSKCRAKRDRIVSLPGSVLNLQWELWNDPERQQAFSSFYKEGFLSISHEGNRHCLGFVELRNQMIVGKSLTAGNGFLL